MGDTLDRRADSNRKRPLTSPDGVGDGELSEDHAGDSEEGLLDDSLPSIGESKVKCKNKKRRRNKPNKINKKN